MKRLTFMLRQLIKMCLQHILMPLVYSAKRRKYKDIQNGLYLFADSHTAPGQIPFAMTRMYETLEYRTDLDIRLCITKFDDLGKKQLIAWIINFMDLYARAEVVFVCDSFLPVASCNKRPETRVVQLWHSGGLLKKSGFDTGEDIPKGYRGNVYKNIDLWTLSAPVCIPVFTRITRMPEHIFRAIGISRSDYYFDDAWNKENENAFYARYPKARNKKVILWAPTFRGNAGMPRLEGAEIIRDLMEETKEEYHWIIKLHPHLEGKGMSSNCDIQSSRLFGVADLLITDYSSILFDYMAYNKPFVFFAPDRQTYEKGRGFYVPYDSFPTTIAETKEALKAAIAHELTHRDPEDIRAAYAYHMSACDGCATQRILEEIRKHHL